MSLICKDCGCEDVRYSKLLGYHCSNCACTDLKTYNKSEPLSEHTKMLKERYKSQIEATKMEVKN